MSENNRAGEAIIFIVGGLFGLLVCGGVFLPTLLGESRIAPGNVRNNPGISGSITNYCRNQDDVADDECVDWADTVPDEDYASAVECYDEITQSDSRASFAQDSPEQAVFDDCMAESGVTPPQE